MVGNRKGERHRFGAIEDRIGDRVLIGDGCWRWLGAHDRHGYGVIRIDGVLHRVHRVLYELLVGPIPGGLQIDHLCRDRGCCRPAHMEPVTHRENGLRGVGVGAINARKTHCIRGHEFTLENTRIDSGGGRQCRTCDRLRPSFLRKNEYQRARRVRATAVKR